MESSDYSDQDHLKEIQRGNEYSSVLQKPLSGTGQKEFSTATLPLLSMLFYFRVNYTLEVEKNCRKNTAGTTFIQCNTKKTSGTPLVAQVGRNI